MRKAVVFKNVILAWFFSKVLKNTIWTVFLGALIGGSIPLLFTVIPKINILMWIVFLPISIAIFFMYIFLTREKELYRSDFNNRRGDWKSNELRPLGVVATIKDALFLQFFDIPYTLNKKFSEYYAFEFKAKILTDVFSWTISSDINRSNMKAYMFQYSPVNKTLRPHFLVGYDDTNNSSQWITPEIENSPLRTITELELEERGEWFHIRTEVRRREFNQEKAGSSNEDKKVIIGKDGSTFTIEYNPENLNKMLDIRIYDMNNYWKEVYHVVYTEPPFMFLGGEYIGFRNFGIESALYKDVKVYKLSD